MAALMNEDLPEKSGFTNMNLKRQRTLCTGIYKTLNKLNPGYMNNFFELRNADKLVKSKAKSGNSKIQSNNFWRIRSKEHWSKNMT